MLEITKPRGPCLQLDVYGPSIKQEIYDAKVKALDPTSPRWGMSGFYASVIAPGPVGPGDPIEVLATLALTPCNRQSESNCCWLGARIRTTAARYLEPPARRIARRRSTASPTPPPPCAARSRFSLTATSFPRPCCAIRSGSSPSPTRIASTACSRSRSIQQSARAERRR